MTIGYCCCVEKKVGEIYLSDCPLENNRLKSPEYSGVNILTMFCVKKALKTPFRLYFISFNNSLMFGRINSGFV